MSATRASATHLFTQALNRFGSGELAAAKAACERSLVLDPQHCDALHLLGTIALRELDFPRAFHWLTKASDIDARQAEIQVNCGIALIGLEDPQGAIPRFMRALELDPAHTRAWNHLGSAQLTLREHDDALASFQRALALDPASWRTHNNLASVLLALGRPAQALQHAQEALSRRESYAHAWCNLGMALAALGRDQDALDALGKGTTLDSSLVDPLVRYGELLTDHNRIPEALRAFARALALRPGSSVVLGSYATALLAAGDPMQAVHCYGLALGTDPENVTHLVNRGTVLTSLGRDAEALEDLHKALRISPEFANAHNSLGALLHRMKRLDESIFHFESLERINPDFPYVQGNVLHKLAQRADWSNRSARLARICVGLQDGARSDTPFSLLSAVDSPELQRRCGEIYTADQARPVGATLARSRHTRAHPRIRVAYVSADWRPHPICFLMSGVFREHDRDAFEIMAVALTAPETTGISGQIFACCDKVADATGHSSHDIARLLADWETDIVVDLMGHTQGSRPSIYAWRPAPVAIQHLGFPGTTGSPYIDYLVADEFLVPEVERKHYSERLILLPECFQSNDDRRPINSRLATRASYGLADDKFVFCSFNNTYKINPECFSVWMRILQRAPGSVLWLLAEGATAEGNLRREAAAHGVDPQRLIFAGRVHYELHFERLALADLFLDTLPFNAGTTASDALWSGLPVLTCAGRAFAARMAGSLLTAVGLPELVTDSWQAYEELAVQLATDRPRLAALRERLAANRLTTALFDTVRHTRQLEQGYRMAHERALRGEAPIDLHVPRN